MRMAPDEFAPLNTGRDQRPVRVKVWDPVVRIFHWCLVGMFTFSFLTGDEWKAAHVLSGYIILGIISVRVLWGIVGSEHARFANFIYAPHVVARFLFDTARLRAKRYLGHNPAGGAMVIALLSMVTCIGLTGYMMTTDVFWGMEWVEDVHKTLVYLTIALVCLHVVGVILASLEHRENLVISMITGWKRRN
ncbi:cytochrome b/b6 domain-containing protein [Ensifer oleiphilus]